MSDLVKNIWQSAKGNGLILLGAISFAFSILLFSLFSSIQPEKMAKGIVTVHVISIGIADNWDGVGSGIIPEKKFHGKSKKDAIKPQSVNYELKLRGDRVHGDLEKSLTLPRPHKPFNQEVLK